MCNLMRRSLSSLAAGLILVGFAWGACPQGDLNGDCEVDYHDLKHLADQWLLPPGSAADLDGLNGVEARDFALLAGKWGQGGIPLVINEVTVIGSRCVPFPQAIAALASGEVEVADLISRRFPLHEALKALKEAESTENIKVLIDVK